VQRKERINHGNNGESGRRQHGKGRHKDKYLIQNIIVHQNFS
jgi:hypothetical protein